LPGAGRPDPRHQLVSLQDLRHFSKTALASSFHD
jgi:hypothetical protein